MTAAAEGVPGDARETVEQVVRQQLAKALGGRRGMLEAAVPTLIFTILWLSTRELSLALALSAGSAALLLAVRVAQRSTVQYCVNALVGIGIGWLFVTMAARGGGTEDEQALAYFLPGILYNAVYAVLLAGSAISRWPLVGFMIGSVTGDPTGWREDPQVVRLCSLLTWLLALPCVVRVAAQAPVYLAARGGQLSGEAGVALLGVMKVAMGWPLTLAMAAAMVWVLGRDRTPVTDPERAHHALDPDG